MKSQSEFCVDLLPHAYPTRARPPETRLDPHQKVVERLDRLRRLRIESASQRTVQIKSMIADFERMADRLDAEIRVEQNRTGIHDAAHFAYSTCARAMTQRRDNLKRSVAELNRQLADAIRE